MLSKLHNLISMQNLGIQSVWRSLYGHYLINIQNLVMFAMNSSLQSDSFEIMNSFHVFHRSLISKFKTGLQQQALEDVDLSV